MMKFFVVLLSLVALISTSAFCQPLPCAPGADRLFFTDWSSSTVREACEVFAGQVQHRVVANSMQAISQILPQPDGSLFAYNVSGKLTLIRPFWDGGFQRWDWRLPGSGRLMSIQGNSAETLYPWESEGGRFYFYDLGNYYAQPVTPQSGFPFTCMVQGGIAPAGDRLCQDIRTNRVWFARNRLMVGPDFNGAVSVFGNEDIPINLVVSGSRRAFALIGNRYIYGESGVPGLMVPSRVIPGRLVEITANAGQPVVQVLLPAIDVDGDVMQQKLAATDRYVYAVVGEQAGDQRYNHVVRYDLTTGEKSIFLSGKEPGFPASPFISGLAVVPTP